MFASRDFEKVFPRLISSFFERAVNAARRPLLSVDVLGPLFEVFERKHRRCFKREHVSTRASRTEEVVKIKTGSNRLSIPASVQTSNRNRLWQARIQPDLCVMWRFLLNPLPRRRRSQVPCLRFLPCRPTIRRSQQITANSSRSAPYSRESVIIQWGDTPFSEHRIPFFAIEMFEERRSASEIGNASCRVDGTSFIPDSSKHNSGVPSLGRMSARMYSSRTRQNGA